MGHHTIIDTTGIRGLIASVAASVIVVLATPAHAQGPKPGLTIKGPGLQLRYGQHSAGTRHRVNLKVDTGEQEQPTRRYSIVSPSASARITQSETPSGTITSMAFSWNKNPGKLNRRWLTTRVARRSDEKVPFRTHAANLYDEHRDRSTATATLSRSAPGELVVTNERIVWTPTVIGRMQGRKVLSVHWSDVKGITVEPSTHRDHALISVSPRSRASYEKIYRIPDTLVGQLRASLPEGFRLKEIPPLPAAE
jgi:hypothetical protein